MKRKLRIMGSNRTLEQVKLRRKLVLVATVCVLAGLVAYSVLRPDPEERKLNELKNLILDRKPERMSQKDRDALRAMMEKLSPETRERLVREVMKAKLQEFREKTAGMTLEEKRRKVDEAVRKMRKRFVKMSDEKRAKMRRDMNSPEAKKRMKAALSFYYSDFSPAERELMDPVVEELTIEMNALERRARR